MSIFWLERMDSLWPYVFIRIHKTKL